MVLSSDRLDMGQKAISGLMDKWMNDVAFRAAIRKDPGRNNLERPVAPWTPARWKAFKPNDWVNPMRN